MDRLGDPAPDIKLEYRDEYGRLLTLKEAYRQLSYRFHGQKPGKKKQDKRLKKIQEEIKAKKIFSGTLCSPYADLHLRLTAPFPPLPSPPR